MSHCPGPVCDNEECPCATPGRVCGGFIRYWSQYCARCGWERHDHDRSPLIHNGRKP